MAHEDDLKLGCLLVADELASPLLVRPQNLTDAPILSYAASR